MTVNELVNAFVLCFDMIIFTIDDSHGVVYIVCVSGDSFRFENGSMFSTPERDNDQSPHFNCAKGLDAAFWHGICFSHSASMNGQYVKEGKRRRYKTGIMWPTFFTHKDGSMYSLTFAEMKLRPV